MKKLLIFIILLLTLIPFVNAVPHFKYFDFSNDEDRFTLNNNDIVIKDDLIFNEAYYSIDKINWNKIKLKGINHIQNNNWIISQAKYTIPKDTKYLTFFSCSNNNGWDCHQSNSEYGSWQLISFNESLICKPGEIIFNNKCIDLTCNNNDNICPLDSKCTIREDNDCVKECYVDLDCPSFSTCKNNKCEISNPYSVNETYIQTVEWETNDSAFFINDMYSHITSMNNHTFFVWTDSNLRPKVGMIYNDKVSIEYLDKNEDEVYINRYDLDENGSPIFDAHLAFSIGVDKDGYIHIAGGMHNFYDRHIEIFNMLERFDNSKALYWVSKKPYDISQFEFVGNNPNRVMNIFGPTYLRFLNDMEGNLYIRSRSGTFEGSKNYAGKQGWTSWRYNTNNKTWTTLGEIPPPGNNNINKTHEAIFWEDNGIDGGFYQAYMNDMKFDLNNRMHVTAVIINDDGQIPSHLVYAYSDDLGETFYRADNSLIESLPIRVDEGPNQGDVIAKDNFSNHVRVGMDIYGTPVIFVDTYSDAFKGLPTTLNYWYWNKTSQSWSDDSVGPIPRQHNKGTYDIFITKDGMINYLVGTSPTMLYRTNSFNNTGIAYSLGEGAANNIDYNAAMQDNTIRYIQSNSNKSFKIIKLEIIKNENKKYDWQKDLISHFDFEDGVIDTIGNVEGYVRNATHTSNDCIKGSCYSFSEKDESLIINLPTPRDDFTFGLWFKASSESEQYSKVFRWIKGLQFNYRTPILNQGEIKYYTNNTSNVLFSQIPNTFDNKWHFFAVSINNTSMTSVQQFINGENAYYTKEINGNGIINQTSRLYLGDYYLAFKGSIDEVMLWNRSLSIEELKYFEHNFQR